MWKMLFERAFSKLINEKCLKETDREEFKGWLECRARSLHKRDKNKTKGTFSFSLSDYCCAICNSILAMKFCSQDAYTGENLDWSCIGKYNNEDARLGGKQYKKRFAMMPTVDHIHAEPKPEFIICSWQTNDIKNDMTLDELKKWCEVFLKFQK